ncbi:ATP-binding protein [Actinomadura oligospora]|uniref:ATP-binding protein n=1 Tax=Actinomadura oligospora TaxID=111804 RepID=UPI00047D799F|nr:LuxR family transcriptional regulator [Actinomadura oligospora]
MGMVERSERLRALEDMLDAARGGTGSVVLVEGAAGVGKTALLHALAERATASGAVFAGASASSLERNMPLATVGQIFEERVLSGDERARAARLLRDGALTAMAHDPGTPSGAPVALPPLVLGGLSDILLGLADRTPVVVGVDDVQHFDELSRQVLLYVARRVRSARILLVATGCPRTGDDASSFHADLPRLPGAHRMRLEPLSRQGTEAVIEERLGPAAARRLADEAHRATGGNPLLVRALVEDQPGRADDSESPVFASAFRQAVLYCVHHSGLARFAAGLAALGDRVGDAPRADGPCDADVRSAALSPAALVGELLRLDAESTGEHRERLAAIGLLGASGLCHEAVETAVLRSLPAAERRELLGRAADVLYGRGAPAPVVADRLMAADRLDGPWGVQVLRDAAEQAQAEGRFALAVDQLRLALREASGDEARHAARFALAGAECRLDPSIAARHLPALIRALHDRPVPDEEGTAFVVGLLLWLGRSGEALNLVAEPVPAEATPFARPPGLDGPIAGRYWWLPDAYPGLVGRSPFPTTGRADPPGGGDLRALSVARRLLAGDAPGRPADPGRRARLLAEAEAVLQEPGSPPPVPLAVHAVLVALLHIDELERVEGWCDDRDKAARARSPLGAALTAALRAKIHLRRGELVEAEQRAREALDTAPPAAWGVAAGIPLAALLAALTRLGDLAEAQRVLSVPVPPAMWDTPAVLPYLRARGRYHLAVGAPRAALAEFHACGELMTLWEMDLPSLVPWRTDAAEAHLRLGEIGAARRAAEEQMARLAHGGARTRGITLHVLALASATEERPRLLTEAIHLLEQAGDRLERARALSALSDAYRAMGHEGTARALWRRADLLFAECGADGVRRTLADSVTGDHVRADGAHDGPWEEAPAHDPLVELSDAERRVAEYAANGYTNRQIARRLHVTMSTVEQHLTRVYRKLSITRRTDLPLRLTMPSEEFTA